MSFKRLNIQKISVRLTMKYTIFIFLTLALMSAITLFSVRYYTYNQTYSQIENISAAFLHKIKENEIITENDLNDISLVNENIDINVRKYSEIIFTTAESYGLDSDIEPMIKPKSVERGESNLVYINESFKNEKGDVFTIQVIKDMDNEREFLSILFWILLVLNCIAFMVSILLGYIMSKRALNPIEELVTQAKSISASDLSMRIAIEGPDDELKRLAITFNDMISRIEKGYEKQNRFALDASHELATPLAVIKGYVDIVSRWGKNDPEVLDEAIIAMGSEVRNMTKLLDALLEVAKNDNEVSTIEMETIWINELMIEVLKEIRLIYPNHHFELKENYSVLIAVDPRLMKQMLRALIDNSVKYSKNQTIITISSIQEGNKIIVSVSDEGVGIPEDEIPYIFERFYRVDKARTRDIGGFGLGLSIVKWIVDKHSGIIEVVSKIGIGTRVIIKLPIISPKREKN